MPASVTCSLTDWIADNASGLAVTFDCAPEDLADVLRSCADDDGDRLANASVCIARLIGARPGHTGEIAKLLSRRGYAAAE